MAEYIDREALIGRLRRNLTACNPNTFSERCYADAIETVKYFPAADVAPVRHGHWIEDGDYQICSECGEEHCWDEYRAAYCDSCGAKMDGGDSDAVD